MRYSTPRTELPPLPRPRPALLYVNPATVVAAVESERQGDGLPLPGAVLRLNTGHEHTVEDGARSAARQIREARGRQEQGA